MAYKLVVFDFDGTLADSADWMRRTINHVADRYRFKRLADDEFAALRWRDNRAIIRHLGVSGWKMPFIAKHMRTLMRRDADQIRLFAGASDLLRRLHAGGIALAIVSSNTEGNVRRIFGAENAARISHYAGAWTHLGVQPHGGHRRPVNGRVGCLSAPCACRRGALTHASREERGR